MRKFSVILWILSLILLTLSSFTNVEFESNDCSILHNGTFKYGNSGDEIKVVIKGKNHTEYHNNEKYIIKSKLDWVNDCEYNMTMKKITIPNFPYGIGDVMNVKINKVVGNEIYYTSTVKGKSWEGKLIKIK